jgi:hypothetical protein
MSPSSPPPPPHDSDDTHTHTQKSKHACSHRRMTHRATDEMKERSSHSPSLSCFLPLARSLADVFAVSSRVKFVQPHLHTNTFMGRVRINPTSLATIVLVRSSYCNCSFVSLLLARVVVTVALCSTRSYTTSISPTMTLTIHASMPTARTVRSVSRVHRSSDQHREHACPFIQSRPRTEKEHGRDKQRHTSFANERPPASEDNLAVVLFLLVFRSDASILTWSIHVRTLVMPPP